LLNDFFKPFTRFKGETPAEPTTIIYYEGKKLGDFTGKTLSEKLNALLKGVFVQEELKKPLSLNLPPPSLITEPFLRDNEEALRWLVSRYSSFTVLTTEPEILKLEFPEFSDRIEKLPGKTFKRLFSESLSLPVLFLEEGGETFVFKPKDWGGKLHEKGAEE
jgi:hypothetical protein